MKKSMRLDKILSHSGYGSRKDIKAFCKQGNVTVDGVVCRDSSLLVQPEAVDIRVQGKVLSYEAHYYLLLHKPKDVISARRDEKEKTVVDLLPPLYAHAGVFPVGRLDKDTTGLLLLTNDGTWAHRIMSPKKHTAKTYEAVVAGRIPADIQTCFATGLVLRDGTVCQPAQVQIQEANVLDITIYEGQYHQIKRMCAAVGLRVCHLHRRAIGGLVLDDTLPMGAWRKLTAEERELPFVCK